ncbi:MFS transporter [Oscillibacter hominis]|uniref:MFS transporter n=1 Tax=Oscillibacter hominis TaxID=2763056 RepID=A0A7G9B1J6_9FIRM|nr:MFS transporter [Oscillibacter hominis]QNL43427.1 MFS transporter [Oscillibacter hominis]
MKPVTLFRRDFTLVVIGQIISLFGNAILRFALPLYLLRSTGSSTLFGAVNAAAFVPLILCSPLGGVLADRFRKQRIMVYLDFSTAGLIFLFYLLYDAVPLVPLMVVSLMLLYGISGAYQPAVQSSIPALIPPEQITQANAVINMVSTLSGLLGPVTGGILFSLWGIVPILLVSVFCFLASAVMELFIHIPCIPQSTHGSALAVVRGDLRESWQFIRREKPVFLPAVAVLALFNLVLSAAMIVGIPVMVVTLLGMGDTALGMTQGALGLGGLAGGVLAGILGGRLKLRHGSLLLAVCALTAGVMGAALLPGVPRQAGYLLITVMSFTAMAASTLFTVLMCSAVQRQTPPHLIGKVMAFVLAAANCASPLGQALYGRLFDLWDGCFVALGAAASSLLIALYARGVFLRLERENG